MTITRIDQYTPDGRLRVGYDAWSIYAAFTREGLVKIGRSTNPMQRLYSIHCGSPFPLAIALWTWVGGKSKACSIERTIHNRLAQRRTRGEWFSFDYTNAEDKALFHAVTKAAHLRVVGSPLRWKQSSLADIKALAEVNWKKQGT